MINGDEDVTYKNIRLDYSDAQATITIDREKYLNALNYASLSEIKDALKKCQKNNRVKVIVFKGAGEKAFIAGADIQELKTKDMTDMLEPDGFQELFTYIDNYEKPTIAAINGFTLGGGCELAMACDIRIATENSVFGLPELNLSILPAAGGTQRLAKLVGLGNALYMVLTGKKITGREAKEMGLINEVVERKELDEIVNKVVQNISSKSPIALKLAKITIKKGVDTHDDIGLMLEKVAQALLFTTEDKEEGMDAFIEKRNPTYVGK